MNKLLSVIIPAYNEEQNIAEAAAVIGSLLDKAAINNEIIFVDDGSTDNTWPNITAAAKEHANVHGIRFSRNFGKEAAIMAGLTKASGDCCVVIDCDLQHPPQKILEMYQLWQQGYEVIEGQKSDRGHEFFLHAWAAKAFYALISTATGIDMSRASDFKLLDRKAVDALISMRERNAFFRAMSSWIGFKMTTVEFEVQERTSGTSKWSTKALIKYAVNNISSFSAAPMHLVTILGAVMFVVSCVLGIISLVQKLSGQALEGFTTVILILLFSSSIIMVSLGIIGYYLAKIYDEIKDRPRYIIAAACGAEQARAAQTRVNSAAGAEEQPSADSTAEFAAAAAGSVVVAAQPCVNSAAAEQARVAQSCADSAADFAAAAATPDAATTDFAASAPDAADASLPAEPDRQKGIA